MEKKLIKNISKIILFLSLIFILLINCPGPNVIVEDEEATITGAWVQYDASWDPIQNQYINDYNMLRIRESYMLKGYIDQLTNGDFYWYQKYYSYVTHAADITIYTYSVTSTVIKFEINSNPSQWLYEQWRYVFVNKEKIMIYYGNNFSGTFTESLTPLYYKKIDDDDYDYEGFLAKEKIAGDVYETSGNDIKADAHQVNINITIQSNFHDGTDDDWFKFSFTSPPATKTITIETSFLGDRIYGFCDDTILQLHGAALLDSSDDISSTNLFSKITYLCNANTTYYIMIAPKDSSDDQIGSYQFRISN